MHYLVVYICIDHLTTLIGGLKRKSCNLLTFLACNGHQKFNPLFAQNLTSEASLAKSYRFGLRISWSPSPASRSIQYLPSFSTSRTIFAVQIFTVEQFEIQHWKANEHTYLRKKRILKLEYFSPRNRVIYSNESKSTGFSRIQLSFSSQFIFIPTYYAIYQAVVAQFLISFFH